MAQPTVRNVLFITADQWRGDTLGAVGHPCVKTPNLDRLAADGVLFSKHGVSCVGLSQRGEHKRRFCHIDILSPDDAPRPAVWTYS